VRRELLSEGDGRRRVNGFCFNDEYFMRLALKEAEAAFDEDEVPVGCVVVRNDTVIAKAHNQVERLCDATAHSEMLALTQAFAATDEKMLTDCVMYVTVEPCVMCAGAILLARLRRLVYGCAEPKFGGVESVYTLMTDGKLNHDCEVTGGVLADECAALMRNFFTKKRKQTS